MKANLLAKPSAGRERRAAPRLTPDPLLVLELPSGNRGIVLDISEEGLGFVAGAPLDGEGGSVRFRIAARSVELCEAAGRLVWRDPASQRAGIRFSKVPDELRSIIRACADTQPSAAEARAEDFSEDQPVEAHSVPDPEVARLRAALAARPPLEQNTTQEKPTARGSYKSRAANAATMVLACAIAAAVWFPPRQPTLAHLKWRRTALPDISRMASAVRQKIVSWQPAAVRAVTTARPGEAGARVASSRSSAAASSAVSVIAWPSLDDPFLNAASAASIDSPQASLQTAEAVPSSRPAAVLLATALSVPPAKTPATANSSLPLPATPETATDETLGTPVERAPQTKPLNSAANDSAQTAQELWQETEKGNTSAEITLAKHYLMGDGVPKSCAQAQVLLDAARTRNSTLAQHTLDAFPKYGCD